MNWLIAIYDSSSVIYDFHVIQAADENRAEYLAKSLVSSIREAHNNGFTSKYENIDGIYASVIGIIE